MNEGAWLNTKTGEFAWITEHASWIQNKENADKIGLSLRAYDKLKDLHADFNGDGRAQILRIAMDAGLIRMRGHGSYWTFEFTAKSQDALWTCLEFLDKFAGPLTACRFNNLRTKEQIEMPYRQFKTVMQEDPEIALRVASRIAGFTNTAFDIEAAASDSRKKLLVTKYQVPEWFVNECADADPTTNGTYTEWLVRIWKPLCLTQTGNTLPGPTDDVFDRLELSTELLTEYGRLKNSAEWVRNKTQERGKDAANIMSYRTFEEFEQVVRSASTEDLSKNEQERELQRRRQEYLDEGAESLGSPREGFMCWHPETVQAVRLMSEGSHWCTKGSYADKYFSDGNIYIFTTDDPETSSNYGSDRYAQLFVDADGGKVEMEDVNGNDLYSEEFDGKAWQITEDAWWMVEFVANHDKTLASMIQSKRVYCEGDDGPEFEECKQCQRYIYTDDVDSESIYVESDPSDEYHDSATFCDRGCFNSYYDEWRDEQVDKLMEGHGTAAVVQDAAVAENEWLQMRDNPETIQDPVVRKVIEAFNNAIPAKNIRNSQTNELLTDYEVGWALSNTKAVDNWKRRRLDNGMTLEEIKADLDPKIDAVTPGCTIEDYEHTHTALQPIFDRITATDKVLDDAKDYVNEEFDPNDMDILDILERGDFIPKSQPPAGVEHHLQSSLFRQAKAIQLDNHFLDTFMGMLGNLFRTHAYVYGEDNQKLKDITRRDTTWQLDETDWEDNGIQFVRAGDRPLNHLMIVLQCDPNHAPKSGDYNPVIFAGTMWTHPDDLMSPIMTLLVNGNLTKAEALAQFDPQSPEYPNIRTIVKHEFTHLYDKARTIEESKMTQDMMGDDATYFNLSTEVRAYTGNLLDEFHQYLSRQNGELGNELINAFLRESRFWKVISQHLNSQNRQAVLRELGRDLVNQRSRSHANRQPKVVD